ncbi:hypothetical protein MMJ09_21195, partial [Bacillus vallismortis]|nr:hypothetical protein [Bacillus vallismortis]
FLLFYYTRMVILRKNKGCRDFFDSLRIDILSILQRVDKPSHSLSVLRAGAQELLHSLCSNARPS